jgi:hypothetical protein
MDKVGILARVVAKVGKEEAVDGPPQFENVDVLAAKLPK